MFLFGAAGFVTMLLVIIVDSIVKAIKGKIYEYRLEHAPPEKRR